MNSPDLSVGIDPVKLGKAVARGYRKLAPFRQARIALLDHYTGNYYGKTPNEDTVRRPLGLIYQAVSALVPNLAWDNPRFRVRSEIMALRPYGNMLGKELDHLSDEVDLGRTMRLIVLDTFFGAGIMKVGLCPGPTYNFEGYLHDIGQVYMDRVSLDRYVIDPTARDREEALFEGNTYRIPKQWAQQSGMFDADAIGKLPSASMGDRRMAERMHEMGIMGDLDEVIEYIDLVDLWLPKAEAIVTMPAPIYENADELPVSQILRTVEHVGPERGPYEVLGFHWAPDSVMPIPPAGHWLEMADLGEEIARACGREAARAKSVLAYERKAEQDAKQMGEAEDGGSCAVDDIDALKTVEWGGMTAKNLEGLAVALEQFSRITGNSEQLGGVRSSAGTATQAEILAANIGVRLGDMQQAVYDFVARNARKAAWFLHTDPFRATPLTQRVGGFEVQLTASPETREGDFLDYHFSVEPYSMRRQDPETRRRSMLELVRDGILPAIEMANVTGGLFNANAAISMMARELNVMEIDELWPDQNIVMERLAMLQMTPPPSQQTPAGSGGGGGGDGYLGGAGGRVRRAERFRRDDGPRDRSLRSGDERGSGDRMIDRTRGDRLQRV